MAYDYNTERAAIFTDGGQRDFLKARDHVRECLKKSGAVRMTEAMSAVTGDSWRSLAMIDRLVEIGELREITPAGVAGQDRVFVSTK